MLLFASNKDDTQRIKSLSSAGTGVVIQTADSDYAIVSKISYENISSFLRQCDTSDNHYQPSNDETYVENTENNTINRVNRSNNNNNNGGQNRGNINGQTRNGRPPLIPDEFKADKLKKQLYCL